MDYKLVSPLTTRMVETWEDAVYGKGVDKKPIVSQSMGVVRAAIAAKWFEGDTPDVDKLLPAEVVVISSEIWIAYGDAFMGAEKDKKN
jgi:hypothetical protein